VPCGGAAPVFVFHSGRGRPGGSRVRAAAAAPDLASRPWSGAAWGMLQPLTLHNGLGAAQLRPGGPTERTSWARLLRGAAER
jgi:hypothetical protein